MTFHYTEHHDRLSYRDPVWLVIACTNTFSSIPALAREEVYLPDPFLPFLAHAFTRAYIFCEGSGHQTSAHATHTTYFVLRVIYIKSHSSCFGPMFLNVANEVLFLVWIAGR